MKNPKNKKGVSEKKVKVWKEVECLVVLVNREISEIRTAQDIDMFPKTNLTLRSLKDTKVVPAILTYHA